MRMRRMKNLDSCIDGFGEYFIKVDYGNQNSSIIEEKDIHYFDFKEIFGNENNVQLEIGCGKGQFAEEIARQNPDINFIAIEQNVNVLVTAMERTRDSGLKNLRYIMGMAEYLEKVFPKGSVDRIYLNFSCPFPKNTYAKHRLTHPRFLAIYKNILKDDGVIEQKTDNAGRKNF